MVKIDDSMVKLCDCEMSTSDIGTLCTQIADGAYEPAHHQRPPRWDPAMYVSLIWTLIRGFPLAPIHVCEHPRGRNSRRSRAGVRVLQVNDGGHRLRGIYAYRNNMFAVEVRDSVTDVVVERVYYDTIPREKTARREFTPTMECEVLKRQGNTCAMAECTRNGCEMDHITPLWKGGDHSADNAQWLCSECHKQKTAREATERAKTQVGSPLDRVMTDDERESLNSFKVPIITYKNYREGVRHEDIQRLIFRQVQNGVRMDGNDQIFAEGDPVLLRYIEERLLVNGGICGLASVVKGTQISKTDFWRIEKSGCNIYQITEALFRGTFDGKYQGDTWIPGATHKFTGRGRMPNFEGVTRDRHLRPFEKTLCSANHVVSTCLPGTRLDFEDYAIIMHCCHGYPDFEAFATGAHGRVLDLASMMDAWDDTRSMQPDVISSKMRPLLAAMRAAQGPAMEEEPSASEPQGPAMEEPSASEDADAPPYSDDEDDDDDEPQAKRIRSELFGSD